MQEEESEDEREHIGLVNCRCGCTGDYCAHEVTAGRIPRRNTQNALWLVHQHANIVYVWLKVRKYRDVWTGTIATERTVVHDVAENSRRLALLRREDR